VFAIDFVKTDFLSRLFPFVKQKYMIGRALCLYAVLCNNLIITYRTLFICYSSSRTSHSYRPVGGASWTRLWGLTI